MIPGEQPEPITILMRKMREMWASTAILAYEGASWYPGGARVPVREQLQFIMAMMELLCGPNYADKWFIELVDTGEAIRQLTDAVKTGAIRIFYTLSMSADTPALSDELKRLGEEVRRQGCEVFTVGDQLDDLQVDEVSKSQMIKRMMKACRRYEQEAIPVLMAASKREKAREGGAPGGGLPFGYRLEGVGKTRSIVIDEQKAAIVRRVFALHNERKKASAIVSILEHEGVGKLNVMQVYRILRNEAIYRAEAPLRQNRATSGEASITQPPIVVE